MPTPLSRTAAAIPLFAICIVLSACSERDLAENPYPPSDTELPSVPEQADVRLSSFTLGESSMNCNIEKINGRSADGQDVEVMAGEQVVIEGWVLPESVVDGETPNDWTVFLVDGNDRYLEVLQIERLARPDLLSRASEALTVNAGFRASFRLPPNERGRIGIFLATHSGNLRPNCGAGRGFKVIDP